MFEKEIKELIDSFSEVMQKDFKKDGIEISRQDIYKLLIKKEAYELLAKLKPDLKITDPLKCNVFSLQVLADEDDPLQTEIQLDVAVEDAPIFLVVQISKTDLDLGIALMRQAYLDTIVFLMENDEEFKSGTETQILAYLILTGDEKMPLETDCVFLPANPHSHQKITAYFLKPKGEDFKVNILNGANFEDIVSILDIMKGTALSMPE